MQTLTTSFTANAPVNVIGRNAKSVAGPLALRVLAVTILLPDELGFYVGGLWFSLARVVLFALTPVLLIRLFQTLAAGRYRFVISDLLVPLTGVWIIVALANVDGVQASLNHAGPDALEFCVGYMAARFLLSEHGQAVSFINFLCAGIAVVALLAVPDILTHSRVVHDLVRSLGIGKTFVIGEDERLGYLRPESTLDHPILLGFTCAVGLILAASVQTRGRWLVICACALGALLALSSAPLQGVLFGFALLIYNRILAGIRYRWAALIVLAAAGTLTVFIVFGDPLGFVFAHFVLDTQTAWFRIYIWQTASVAVAQSPWFGMGWVTPEGYGIPGTVDALWLVWALKYGIPGSMLLGLSMIGAASLPTNGPRVRLTRAELRLGTTLGILIFIIIFLGFTVDFYGNAWILIPLLMGVRAHLGELGRVSAQTLRQWDRPRRATHDAKPGGSGERLKRK